MDSGYYAACTALVARMQAMSTIADNLANASTVGYRAEEDNFSAALQSAGVGPESGLNRAINNYGIVSSTTFDFSQGELQKTGNPLDLAIEGQGFFVVQTPNGPMYTRNGNFKVSATGQLVTATGDAVMGDRGVIQLPPGPVSISPDGTISSNGAVTGRVRVVAFPPGTQLTRVGNTDYSAPANTAVPATNASLQQGELESSNVNPISGMVELVTAQYQAEMAQRVLSMFNSDIDKTATQDLPKVG
jgi:flagellar basal-body rod protein FlgF